MSETAVRKGGMRMEENRTEECFTKGGFCSPEEHIQEYMDIFLLLQKKEEHLPELFEEDRKSTRLNSSHP